MMFHKDGTEPPEPDWVFVFGSNLAGIHGAGAARVAALNWGAVPGRGRGISGMPGRSRTRSSYAIPTKDRSIRTLPLETVSLHVRQFLTHAKANPFRKFWVTRIGCGLAGFEDHEIAPLFKDAGKNCSFAEEWQPYLVSNLEPEAEKS